ncbi:MAG: BatA domain-containing protein [Planctomycetales bacterium]|nr:BatA domain-containing protein [Planctomycetales bacterium]
MRFMQPLLLIGLPLAALPIIIHLINLRRHRTVDWGAMMFLLKATQQKTGRTRLRHFLILLARVLAVLGIIFAISRPMAGGWFGLFGGKPDTVIVLLDRSASMSRQDMQLGRTKRDVALTRIVEAINRAGAPPNLVLVEGGTNKPIIIDSPNALLEMPETKATDGVSNIPAMLQATLDHIVANKSGRTDIWICSDIQSGDWSVDSGQWSAIRSGFQELKQKIRFHLLTYEQADEDNLTVRVTDLKRQSNEDGQHLVMSVRVRRTKPDDPVKVPLGIVVDDARTVVDMEIENDMFTLTDHIVPIDRESNAGWGKVEIPNDANPRDNVFYFTFGDDVLRRTAVVSDQPGTSWPLSLAAAPPIKNSPLSARVISSDEVTSIDNDETSLIIWQVPLPTGTVKSNLERFVNDGGSIIFLPPAADDDGEFLGVKWGAWEKMDVSTEPEIEAWRDDSGLWANSDAGKPLPVNRLTVREYRELIGEGVISARLRGNKPLLLQKPTDAGGVYFCATLPQEPYSNLAREGIVLFAMVQRALDQGVQRLVQSQLGVVGDRVASAEGKQWKHVDGWPEGLLSTQQKFVAGIYEIGDKLIARNRPQSEDVGGPIPDNELNRLFDGLEYSVVQDTVQKSNSLVSEIWRLFVAVLIVALIVEAALCLPDVRPKKLVTV